MTVPIYSFCVTASSSLVVVVVVVVFVFLGGALSLREGNIKHLKRFGFFNVFFVCIYSLLCIDRFMVLFVLSLCALFKSTLKKILLNL